MLTPYQYASNRPIDGVDMDELEHLRYEYRHDVRTGETVLEKKTELKEGSFPLFSKYLS